MICINTINSLRNVYEENLVYITLICSTGTLYYVLLLLSRYHSPSVKQSLLDCQNDSFIPYYEGRSLSWLFSE